MNPHNPVNGALLNDVLQTARKHSLQLRFLNADTDDELDDAVSSAAKRGIGALVIASGSFFASRREQLVALVARHALPAIYSLREFVTAGGLISYGPSITDTYRELALYVGKILKGVRLGDLAVHEPTAFELVINLKTTQALHLTVPKSLRDQGAQLIE